MWTVDDLEIELLGKSSVALSTIERRVPEKSISTKPFAGTWWIHEDDENLGNRFSHEASNSVNNQTAELFLTDHEPAK